MNSPVFALFFSLTLLLVSARAASITNTASIALSCDAIRVPPTTTVLTNGERWQIAFDSTETFGLDSTPNGEIGISLSGEELYGAQVRLRRETPALAALATLNFAFPDVRDDNLNALTDFYEVRLPVSSRTRGTCNLTLGQDKHPGLVDAQWARAPSSTVGLLRLTLQFTNAPQPWNQIFQWDTFFEIFDFQGSMTYVRFDDKIEARVELQRIGAVDQHWRGLLPLKRISRTELSIDAARWSGTAGSLHLHGSLDDEGEPLTLLRGGLGTNYFSAVIVDPPELMGITNGFEVWNLEIQDANDSNANGFADLADDFSGAGACGPGFIEIRRSASGVSLTLNGTRGALYQLEENPGLDEAGWSLVQTLRMGAEAVILEVEAAQKIGFWRLRCEGAP